jgi:hypothetical protein
MQCHFRASFARLQKSQPAASEEARTEQPSCRQHLVPLTHRLARYRTVHYELTPTTLAA